MNEFIKAVEVKSEEAYQINYPGDIPSTIRHSTKMVYGFGFTAGATWGREFGIAEVVLYLYGRGFGGANEAAAIEAKFGVKK